VVFVAALSREFNRESTRAQVLCDQDLGLGLSAVDEKNRVRYPTIAKKAIAVKIAADSLSEEMRVLYVALTRAKDRLIMTYSSKSLESDLKDLALRMDMGNRELLTRDVVCPGEWVLMAALRRTEAGELFNLGGYPIHIKPGVPSWKIRVMADIPATTSVGLPEEMEAMTLPYEELASIEKGLAFRYAHTAATKAPSKQTATQRKGRDKDAEAAENAQEPVVIHRKWRKAAFEKSSADGVDTGNATHAVMQYIRYDQCGDERQIQQQVDSLIMRGQLTSDQATILDIKAVAEFFRTSIGLKLACANDVLREFKFSILQPLEIFLLCHYFFHDCNILLKCLFFNFLNRFYTPVCSKSSAEKYFALSSSLNS
jgi:ATP-dependent helicase/nuclease subunit A